MKKNLFVVAAVAVAVLLMGCLPGSAPSASAQAPASTTALVSETETHLDCPICDVDLTTYNGDLNADEIEGLLLALNDEYHAWAIYDQVLADLGDVRPFSSILNSEATHIAALVDLLEAYDVPVPANPWVGNVPSFESVQDAATAAVQAEIDNAALYDRINASTERTDILTVYDRLQSASLENHLPAFERATTSGSSGGNRGGGGRGGR